MNIEFSNLFPANIWIFKLSFCWKKDHWNHYIWFQWGSVISILRLYPWQTYASATTSVFHHSFCHDNLLPACLIWDDITHHAQSISKKGLDALPILYTIYLHRGYPVSTDHSNARPFFSALLSSIFTYVVPTYLRRPRYSIETTY